MSLARLFRSKKVFGLLALVAAAVLVIAFAVVRQSGGGGEADGDQGNEILDALQHHPGLANNRLPLAYVAEKLQNGGEASQEILNGPSQEEYDSRAYPHSYIAPAQVTQDASAYAAALQRASTIGGKALLRKAQGTSTNVGWTELGPKGGIQAAETTYTGTPAWVSGRSTALAFGNGACTATSCVLYVGTAGGGVWRTDSARSATPRWVSIGSSIPSTAIGSVYVAPNGDVYVGTGEGNGSSDNEAGVGLYRSTDGGASFTKVPTFVNSVDVTLGRSVASIAVDPNNPDHLIMGTAVARHGASSVNGGRFTPPNAPKVGVYESLDGGQTWTKSLTEHTDKVDPGSPNGSDFFRGGISKVAFDPTHAGTMYASMFDYGLWRRSGSGPWTLIYKIHNPGSETTSSTNQSRVRACLVGERQHPRLPRRLDLLHRQCRRPPAN